MSANDAAILPPVLSSRHPTYLLDSIYWFKWRNTYNAGPYYRSLYLSQLSERETIPDFNARREMTPIPAFATAAINDVRNSIYQRMGDVQRQGGNDSYQNAVQGLQGGVDNRGSTMNFFLGHAVLTDLLVLGKAGIYVDSPILQTSPTMATDKQVSPYLYHYPAESILNFSYTFPDAESEFQSVLLRDTIVEYDQTSLLPIGTKDRFRLIFLDQEGWVNVQMYNTDGSPAGTPGNESGGPIKLQLRKIPFVLLDIGAGLMKNIADHQTALMNLRSSDISYALKANFPFYVEQKDSRAVGDHLKKLASDGTATTGGQGATDETISTGVMQGRWYGPNLNPPQFINPSSEPLTASMSLQDSLKDEIRQLLNMAVQDLASRSSEGSKQMDNQGLESGLSYIGLVLENGERKISDYWHAYDNSEPSLVKYPETYSLKSTQERLTEAQTLQKVGESVPSQTARRELMKKQMTALLGGRVPVDTLSKIHKEIDNNEWTTSDPDTIIEAHQEGLVGDKLASQALGFPENEYKNAQEDHIKKATAVAEAQSAAQPKPNSNFAARGVPELSANPAADAAKEKEGKPGRGEGKHNKGESNDS